MHAGCLFLATNAPTSLIKMLDRILSGDLHPAYGKEQYPHITILYGFTELVDGQDIHERMEGLPLQRKLKNYRINFDGVAIFETDEYDVLYLVPDEDTIALCRALREPFVSLENEQSFPDYNPHLTLAYCKKGAAEQYLTLFEDSIDDIELIPTKLSFRTASQQYVDYNIRHTDMTILDDFDDDLQLRAENETPPNVFDMNEEADPAAEYQMESLENFVMEAVKTKEAVVRGKKVRKKFSTKPGHKIVNGKEVKMKPAEKRKRKKSIRKLKKKLRKRTSGQQNKINRKRKKSLKKRKRLNVKGRIRAYSAK